MKFPSGDVIRKVMAALTVPMSMKQISEASGVSMTSVWRAITVLHSDRRIYVYTYAPTLGDMKSHRAAVYAIGNKPDAPAFARSEPKRIRTASAQTYLASDEPEWNYPDAGDEPAPLGVKLWLLNEGGAATTGQWTTGSNIIAWARMLKRNKDKERIIREKRAPRRDAAPAGHHELPGEPAVAGSELPMDESHLA